MNSGGIGPRYIDLYGQKRTEHASAIKQTLLQTSVLGGGDAENRWNTSTKTDYRGARPVTADKAVSDGDNHLKTHFMFGKHDDDATYKLSRTREDYITQPTNKPPVHCEDRTIKWPDMAPQYVLDRTIGSTVYSNTFSAANHQPSTPGFPKLNTSNLANASEKMGANVNNRVNVSLGTDAQIFDSEANNAYVVPVVTKANDGTDASDISHRMKTLARKSNVFRTGDYNNAQQESGSMFTLDFCKKLYTPSTLKMKPKSATQKTIFQETNDKDSVKKMPQMIGRHMKEDHKFVLKDAKDGRNDHTRAHFHLGNETEPTQSVYTNDFLKNSITPVSNSYMKFHPAPPSSQVLQFDSEQASIGKPTSTDTNIQGTFSTTLGHVNAEAARNMGRRVGTSIAFTCDDNRYKSDRLHSLSHQSYIGPPAEFKPLKPRTTPKPAYNFMVTDTAMPYSINSSKVSEAQNQFRSISMDAASSCDRQVTNNDLNLSRKEWGQSTHFTTGYQPMTFSTENKELYSGKKKEVSGPPAAGKTEKVTDSEFKHFDISENTQDLAPNPYRVDIMASIPLQVQAAARMVPSLPVHHASIMKNDYQTFANRKYTPAQLMMMRQNERIGRKHIEKSHFFHSDNSGGNNLQTTTMADFIKPELVTTPRNMASVR